MINTVSCNRRADSNDHDTSGCSEIPAKDAVGDYLNAVRVDAAFGPA